jgi:YHS domain-containing protein
VAGGDGSGTDEPGVCTDATADGEPSVDPVCGMEVADKAAATVEHRGETYRFCGEGCAETFAEAPERYLDGTGVTADD